MKVLQTFALPLGYGTGHKKSGRRDSDSRPPPWQGGALPTELLPQKNGAGRNRTTDTEIFSLLLYLLSYRAIKAIRKGLEPSTSSVTGWHSKPTELPDHISGNNRARTCDPLLVRQMLSQLSYAPQCSSRTTLCNRWLIGGACYMLPVFRHFVKGFFAVFEIFL